MRFDLIRLWGRICTKPRADSATTTVENAIFIDGILYCQAHLLLCAVLHQCFEKLKSYYPILKQNGRN
jgi:hypothetical protein